MWFLEALCLCLLSVLALAAITIISGWSLRALWRMLTTGGVLELLSRSGKFCFVSGIVWIFFLLIAVFSPSLLESIQVLFGVREQVESTAMMTLAIWLGFAYYLANLLVVGFLHWRK